MTAPLAAGRLPGTPSNEASPVALRTTRNCRRTAPYPDASRLPAGLIAVASASMPGRPCRGLARDLPDTALHVSSRRLTTRPSTLPLTSAVVWAREVLRGVVNPRRINGMQGVRGSIQGPHESRAGLRATRPEVPTHRQRRPPESRRLSTGFTIRLPGLMRPTEHERHELAPRWTALTSRLRLTIDRCLASLGHSSPCTGWQPTSRSTLDPMLLRTVVRRGAADPERRIAATAR
jgi:hypothetical protein